MTIDKPSVKEVKEKVEKFKKSEEWKVLEFGDKALIKSFQEDYPKNNDEHEITIKAHLLNSLYSTNIGPTIMKSVIENIKSEKINIDERIKLKDKDLKLVEDLAKTKLLNNKEYNFTSFASKYCFFSNKDGDSYPIYDSYVRESLKYLNDKYLFAKKDNDKPLTKAYLEDYLNYEGVLQKFINFFKLNDLSLKDIDIYLWSIGKEIIQEQNRIRKAKKAISKK